MPLGICCVVTSANFSLHVRTVVGWFRYECSGWFCKQLMNAVTGCPLKQIWYTALNRGNLESTREDVDHFMLVRRDFLCLYTSATITPTMFNLNFKQILVAGYFTNMYLYFFCTNQMCPI